MISRMIGGAAAVAMPISRMMISRRDRAPSPQGRARPTTTMTSGYSQTPLKMVGAIRALNAPPTTPPSDSNR
ncbi:hypothetical protein D3C87_1944070 [compost metagenome]